MEKKKGDKSKVDRKQVAQKTKIKLDENPKKARNAKDEKRKQQENKKFKGNNAEKEKPVVAGKKEIVVKEEKTKREKTEKEMLRKKLNEKIKKKQHPVFRGRFGARFKRRKSIEKWDKWRRPRGTDIIFEKEDGALVKIGYRVPKEIRHLHPSGFPELVVSNLGELSQIGQKENVALRFAAGIGKRKRIQMLKIAQEKNLRVLNRWKK
ncbi:MAG: hypothetical protein HYW50_04925 [Candidatus Diapherotrites archaeon]|nr:hypothetical protein [Candidatus Diapherotrites archaeon]